MIFMNDDQIVVEISRLERVTLIKSRDAQRGQRLLLPRERQLDTLATEILSVNTTTKSRRRQQRLLVEDFQNIVDGAVILRENVRQALVQVAAAERRIVELKNEQFRRDHERQRKQLQHQRNLNGFDAAAAVRRTLNTPLRKLTKKMPAA